MLSICFFGILPQINSPKIWLAGKITACVLFAKVMYTCTIKPVYTEILQSLLNDTANYHVYIRVNAIFNVIVEAIYITTLLISTCLFVKELVKKYGISTQLYVVPMVLVLYLIVFTVTAFTQLSSVMLIIFSSVLMISSNLIFFFVLKRIDGNNIGQ